VSETSSHRERVRITRLEARERIVAAATELIRRRSFPELSVEEVMREAGLGRTIFYRHFDDLADLIQRAAREAIEELYAVEQRLAELEAESGPGASTPAAIAAAVAAYSRHGPLLRAIAEAAAGDEQVASGQRAIRARFDALTRGALERLAGFSGPDAADPAEVAHALNLMNEAYLLDAFGREPRVSPQEAERTLTDIWSAVLGRPAA
jgi:TetR/AcrR family transcriptional regulator, ethionamide resistance regulator